MRKSIPVVVVFILMISISTAIAEPPPAGETPPSSAVESGYIEVDGGRIFYEAAGRGPSLVMIHDFLLHRETWNAQFAVFAKNHRVIRWDRRGFGRSDRPKASFSNLDDLLAVMKALKVERATLIGCSTGGLLAIHFALEHPEMVSSLVLVGPIVSGFGFSEHFETRGNRGEPDNDASPDKHIEYWTSKDPWIMAPESSAARAKMRSLLVANPQDVTGSAPYSRWPDNPALERLPQIKVPTLIVVGESDLPDVHTHIGVIQDRISESRRVVLTHSGHLPHIEVPEEFNRVVLEFLETVK